jgi:hypothetical protein
MEGNGKINMWKLDYYDVKGSTGCVLLIIDVNICGF